MSDAHRMKFSTRPVLLQDPAQKWPQVFGEIPALSNARRRSHGRGNVKIDAISLRFAEFPGSRGAARSTRISKLSCAKDSLSRPFLELRTKDLAAETLPNNRRRDE